MEGFSLYSRMYRSLGRKRKWRKYQRINGSSNKNVKIARLGGNNRWISKIKVIPKLQLKLISPRKLLNRLRDAYINTMLGFVSSTASLSSGNGFGGKRVSNDRQVSHIYYAEGYEKRVLFELYTTLVQSRQIVVS